MKTKNPKKVGVLYNIVGSSSTADIIESEEDTLLSAEQINKTLKADGFESETWGISAGDIKHVADGVKKYDFVFNLVEWSGKDSGLGVRVIEEIEKADVPHSGSGPWGYMLSCDKVMMKKKMEEANIPIPKWRINGWDGGYPVIVKPVLEHCSIGVSQTSICRNNQETRNKIQELKNKYRQPILVEEFIDGLEAHVTVLERKGKPWVLPPAVTRFEKKAGYWPILTYESKWISKHWEADMSKWDGTAVVGSLLTEVERIAGECYLKLGGRSYPRIDMRIRDGKVYVLEINNNPGLGFDNDESGITVSAKAAGFDFGALLRNIMENSL